MIKQLLFCFSVACATFTNAQTYFYIDQIAVLPQQPTNTDNVTINLIGGLSSSGAYIVGTSAQVTGSIVTINVVAADPGGLAVIVPHTEPITIGQLTAGTYTIAFNAQNVGDFAPAPQHTFVVSGSGSACDSLDVVSIQWHAFADTTLVVHVMNNNGSEIFDYPNFILFNANHDTLAMETAISFALVGESWHTMRINPDITFPTGPFTGTLELWTLFTTELACTWTIPVDLCPPPPCATLYPAIQNLGGGIPIGTYDWTIYDSDFVAAGNGQFTLTNGQEYDTDTLCLPPGSYAMEVSPNDPPTGGAPVFNVSVEGFISGPSQAVSWSLPVPMPFDFYLRCTDSGNGIATTSARSGISAVQQGSALFVQRSDGSPLGNVELFDVQGRSCFYTSIQVNSTLIPVSELGYGIFIVHAGRDIERVMVLVQ
jgi:hypothetical protein